MRKPLIGGKKQQNRITLGECYEKGQGVSQSFEQAAYWTKKAAEQGNVIAQNVLGHYYRKGQGVPQDFDQAIYWFKKAAEQGDADAQQMIGICENVRKGFQLFGNI